jgi:hypothetical protein
MSPQLILAGTSNLWANFLTSYEPWHWYWSHFFTELYFDSAGNFSRLLSVPQFYLNNRLSQLSQFCMTLISNIYRLVLNMTSHIARWIRQGQTIRHAFFKDNDEVSFNHIPPNVSLCTLFVENVLQSFDVCNNNDKVSSVCGQNSPKDIQNKSRR